MSESDNNGITPPDGVPAMDPGVESLETRVARYEKEKTELHDRMLRIAADFENFKKRARREQDESASRGRETLLKELLPVLDNLERALDAVAKGGTVQALGDGVRMVDKQFHGILEKFDVKGFDALGQAFDPSRHEAIQQMDSAQPAGSVAHVFARGYTVGDRLLRPAMVAVSRGPSQAAAGETGDGAGAPDEGDSEQPA